MIYCSHCGTQNRDGSKFCSNCAARLAPPSGLVCPMCSTSNPVENVFCLSCGARLIPLTGGPGAEKESAPPIRGLSLPAKPASPSSSSTEEEIKQPTKDETDDETEDAPITREKIEDWLTKLRESPPVEDETTPLPLKPPPAPPSTPAPATEFPNWAQKVEPPIEQATTTPSASEESVAEKEESATSVPGLELPSWLKDVGGEAGLPEATPQVEKGTPSTESQIFSEELPSWLQASSEEKQELAKPPPVAIPEEPQAELAPQPLTSEPVIPEPTAPTPIELEPIAPEPPEAPRVEEIPHQFADVKPSDVLPVEPSQQPKTEEKLEPARAEEIPPWIAELKPAEDESAASPQFPQVEEKPEPANPEPARAEEIPPWIAELKPAEGEPAPPVQELEGEVHTEELADWLRAPKLEPSVPILPIELTSEPAEASGPLANLRGILPLALAMTESHPAVQAPPSEKKDGAHLFEEIFAEPQVPTPRPARRRARAGLLTMRPLIYLSLAFAIIFALFIPPGFSGVLMQISGTPAAEFYDAVESLPSNSTVLISFDYDPSLSGEMDLVSLAILRHLIEHRINIVALSTLDTGPMIAQRMLANATANTSDYRYGINFLNAGLVPGHESGLAQLATQGFLPNTQDFELNRAIGQYPIAGNIKNIKSVPLVIELAGGEETLKNWIEQFGTRVNVRIAAGVSAAVEPKARVYRDASQLKALLSGPVAAAQYEILAKQPGEAVRRAAAQSAGQIVLIMTVLAGNAALLISRMMGKK